MAYRSYRSGPQFHGNMDMLAHTHSVRVAGRYPREAGWSLGKDQHGIPRLFDHVMMRDRRLLTAPLLMFLGDFGSGKTTLGMRMLTHAFMMNVRGGLRARIAADSTKRSGNVPEWMPFVEEFGERTVDLAADFKEGINILDKKLPLRPQDHMRNLSELMQDDGTALSPAAEHILRVGLHHEFKKEDPHVKSLNSFFSTVDLNLISSIVQELALLNEGVIPRLSQEDINNISRELYFRLANLMNGKTGEVLGGYGSLAEAMTQRVVSFDYTQLDPDAVAPVQSFIWRVKTAGIRYGDNDYFCDAELYDESYESWDSMAFALGMRGRTKKLRGTGSLLIFISQHISDYLAISGPQGLIAQNMLRDVGAWAIAQHEPVHLPYIIEYCGVSPHIAQVIPRLKPGEFLMKIGSQQPFVFNYELTEMYRRMSDTDAATRRNLERV